LCRSCRRIRPMPQVDYLFDELAPQYRRVELAMAVDGEVMTEANAVQMASALAEFVHLPWAGLTWLGAGHTLASEVAPVGFDSFLLAGELASESAQFKLPKRDGDRPTLLWTTPITEAERQFAQADEHGGQQLRERLTADGNNHIFRPRQQVVDSPE
ncbi:MAG: suppressor of fused domain protein, partial [Pantoea sp.]|nr:suppressor of fused domain protein [Pantoea sp.]